MRSGGFLKALRRVAVWDEGGATQFTYTDSWLA
jgi:hypothetical protein